MCIHIYLYIYPPGTFLRKCKCSYLKNIERDLREFFSCLILKHLTEEVGQVAVSGAHSEVVCIPQTT